MDRDKCQQIALMRYSAIAPLVSGLQDEKETIVGYCRAASEKGVTAPDGTIRHYAPGTIENWYRSYLSQGLKGITPSGRFDCGMPRSLDADAQEYIRYLKENYPKMTAASIFRQLVYDGVISKGRTSESTVARFVNQISHEQNTASKKDMRRYERPHINEVWCGDTCVGPSLQTEDGKKRKFYIIALLDDASRFIVGIDVFFSDNFVNLMSVMKSAVSKYGKPAVWNFDNSRVYKNQQMELLSARLGTTLHYDPPYTPTAKAKIERFYGTLQNQWLASLNLRDFHSLDELRGSLFSYIQSYNQSPHSSLKGKSPQDRFFSEPECIHRLSQEKLDTDFLLEIERRVSADSVVVIDNVEYEVDYRFAKQRIRLRYSPDMKDIFVVDADESLTPIRLLNKQENAVIKREKVSFCRGEED